MRRVRLFLVAMLLVPETSFALQLRWSSGSTDLTISANTRGTLIVQADSAESVLPSQGRLLWTADSSGIQFVALDPSLACQSDTANVSAIEQPATPSDSAANQITAHFCADGNSPASLAYYLVDLVGGSKGKLKVVSLDPTDPDSSRIIESNEVTFNGGITGNYPPTILRATSIHTSLELRVTAVGAGLNSAGSMSIVAPDSSWTLPLTVMIRNDRSLTGIASVAAVLPACQATIGSEMGAVSMATIPADEEPEMDDPQSGGCSAQFFEELLFPQPLGHGYTIQPKDFAFTKGFVDPSSHKFALHLFYIRHNYWYYPVPSPPAIQHPDLDEKNLGHAWTTDFNSWQPNPTDTTALTVRAGKFDELHVWAPSIVQRGPTYHMFYTGVDEDHHQRIGVATSTDLNTWTPADDAVLTAPQVPWAKKDPAGPPYGGAQQLRDPFVMEDPVNPGQWLMYFVAVDSLRAPKMAVGAARSLDLVNWTALANPFSSTGRSTFQGQTNVVESAHVFRRNGQWWMPYTVNGDQVFFETTTSADPADTVAANWTDPTWLREVSEGSPAELQFWHASEYLRINSKEYLAAFDDNASSIDIKGMFAPANAAVDSFLLSCPQVAGVADQNGAGDGVRMAVSRLRGASGVGLRMELPSRMPVRLAAYDIAGRRRSVILDRELPLGMTELTWDGRDESGVRMASGIYFIRLTCARGALVSKIVMLR